jgi:uncharacterized protein (TIGR02271 family)
MQDRTTAIATFNDRTQAQQAIEQLKRAGFTEKEIGVTARDAATDSSTPRTEKSGTHAAEGAVAGVTAGAGVGALWGLGILAGILPAIGPAIAGGTLAALLSSAAAGAAAAGIGGALIGMGIPEDEAEFYDQEFRSGRVLVTVQAAGRFGEAQSILTRGGGYDMRAAGARPSTANVGTRAQATADVPGRRTIEAREEEVGVRTRPVQTGEAEIRKEVTTEQRTLDVPVRKEELVIERHSVGRHPAGGPVGGDERVRIPLSEEQIEIEKKPVVTEEVSIGKRATQENERIATTVRKENIKVDKRGRSDTRSTPR